MLFLTNWSVLSHSHYTSGYSLSYPTTIRTKFGIQSRDKTHLPKLQPDSPINKPLRKEAHFFSRICCMYDSLKIYRSRPPPCWGGDKKQKATPKTCDTLVVNLGWSLLVLYLEGKLRNSFIIHPVWTLVTTITSPM